MYHVAEMHRCSCKEIKIQTTVFTDLEESTTPHLMVKTIKGNASWKQWNNGRKTQACFSISIIVVGFISGIHYCLIGLIRKRHDCITNSTRACQDGFISIPVPFLEKHLVISVWWNYCAQPFIDLGCKTSRLPICNNKPPSAAQPLQAQQRSRCKNDFCLFWVELSEAEIKQERKCACWVPSS